ncbi:DUF262 domain-containing protein [Chryseobacterium defluvii]|uniref:Uncharacterized protein with ParB-like and HNH nuclease domain n=1 Tax=Chryseobacterium defluvii TaxID=160396 RepID=A0A495SCZ5_9FLAO|nr:DUF262 domain-containing protein [Chryseobacterium defluvii]RKS97351.1 uncharacterized protein with ParB-like and HNH nuclease domain [Chryseobacterium defluvii]
MSNSAANKIDAQDKNLNELLSSKKYIIDFFQREYKWQKKHIEQLLIDIEEAFLENYTFGDSIEDVSKYNSYYMGPVIFYNKNGTLSIIDGQQRLTSLTLLFIYIYNFAKESRIEIEPVEDLIYSRKFGKNSYNLDIPERKEIMDFLYKKEKITDIDENPDFNESKNLSIINIYDRYQDIKLLFPENLKTDKLNIFIEWLKEKLIFVEITAFSDKNAYTIFETMNDRGYNLTPSEMLKSYLLSKIDNENFLNELNSIWKEKISKLHSISVDEDLEFFRAWLRGQYAETMKKSTSAGTDREDFEKIGTSFHSWVKEKSSHLKLKHEENYYYFVKGDFSFYSDLYLKIKKLEKSNNNNLPLVNHLTNYNIATSLSYPLYLAAVKKTDSEDIIESKIDIISKFIERFIIYRTFSREPISQTAIRQIIFKDVITEIRDLTIEELIDYLNKIINYENLFKGLTNMRSYFFNRKFIRYFFARISEHLNLLCDINEDFYDLISARRKNGTNIINIFEYKELENNGHKDEYFNIANTIIKLKSSSDGKNENILYRYLVENDLTDKESEILYNNFGEPKEYKLNKNFFNERSKILIKICEDVWQPISLD